jgi:RNA polymerase sigma factor (TIGR02999 family)
MAGDRNEVTRLLDQWSQGDPRALDRLMPLVVDDLRKIAGRHLAGESPGHTLQPTALVNEAYLRLVGQRTVRWRSRAQFFAFLGEMMRRILVDHARRRQTAKRGGGAATVVFDESIAAPSALQPDLVAVDDALRDLEALDPRLARVVGMRFFAGLTAISFAEVLGVSSKTVQREWKIARLWLFRELRPN